MDTIVSLIISLIILVISSIFLTESIEAIGRSMKFTHSFTGAIISPLFTSSAELVIIVLSLIEVGGTQGNEIAAGTVIGEPFMVSSVGFSFLLLSFIIGRNNFRGIKADGVFPITFIMLSLTFPVMLIPLLVKGVLGKISAILILAAVYIYMLYFYHSKGKTIEETGETQRKSVTLLKLVAGFILLIYGSHIMVNAINSLSLTYRISAELFSILIIPIGTIAPETMNSIIWAFKGKIDLAIGAIIGEEMLFATFYPALGIVFTTWDITIHGILAILFSSIFSFIAGIAMLSGKGWKWILLFSPAMLMLFLLVVFY